MGADSAALTDLVPLFEAYREHYGQPRDAARATAWLESWLAGGRLRGFLARVDGEPAGMTTVAPMPASLRLGGFWQVRDLYVAEPYRRQGVAAALLTRVREEAAAAGALRVSLSTESGNVAALAVYEGLGFERIDGYTSLAIPLG